QPEFQYLTSVACKILADHKQNAVRELKPEDKPWGLISIALGNSKNRNQFCERAFFAPKGDEGAEEREKAGEYLTIWEWKNQYQGPTFLEAKQAFLRQEKILNDYLEEIQFFASLHEKLLNKTSENLDKEIADLQFERENL